MRAALLLAFAFAPALGAATPQLIWDDEFNGPVGSGPDTTKWTYELGGGGWGNDELETYTNLRSNSLVVADADATDGKALAIRAQAVAGGYTSARINTSASYSFTYGRMEVRAKVPTGIGLWPAFWALGSNISTVSWPACGEIDVMEWVGQTPSSISGSMHAPGYNGANGLTAADLLPGTETYSESYHVFAVDWYPGEIVWSVDGVPYETRLESDIPAGSAWPFTDDFYIILNLAVGGDWPGSPNADTVFPQDYRVDYVRVYSLPTTPPPSLVWAPSPPLNPSAYFPAALQANVTWQPPFSNFGSVVTGYILERANDAGFTQNVTSWNLGTATSFNDITAVAGTTYFYRVSAVSADGTSDPSQTIQASALNPGPDAKLLDISTRGFVGTGPNNLVAGFYIAGSTSKTVLIRASGPALAADPFDIQGTLPDPMLQLYSGSTVIQSNKGWGGNAQIVAAASSAHAFTWSNAASADSALLATLSPGAYTAVISGASGDTGTALIEVYDVTEPGDSSRLTDIASRAYVGTGTANMIAGFYVGGSENKTVLVRASGPALALAPFNLTGVLPDPELQIYSGSTVFATNTGWAGDPLIESAAAAVGAFPWSDPSSNDAALLLTLPPGSYTAVVSGANGDTGISLLEVYDVP